jgi:hypothetical protein
MLTYNDRTFGIQEFELNLLKLYPVFHERQAFRSRFAEFLKSDSSNESIFSLQGDSLKYRSEVFVSDKIDDRPPLLLLAGNPASHSVAEGICFAFERDGQEHRFWRMLDETGILTFLDQPPVSEDPKEIIEFKRNALLELEYQSPFRVGIAVFYSFPSAASVIKWSGVSGVNKLFRAKAFDIISRQEEDRIDRLITRFIGPTGGIITFQKDAYNRVRSSDAPVYSKEWANQGLLRGKYKLGQNIFLAGAPPTRLARSSKSKSTMIDYKDWLSQKLITSPGSA